MESNLLFRKVKPIELDPEKEQKLIYKIEEGKKISQEDYSTWAEFLNIVNVKFKELEFLGELLFLRADTMRIAKGFDEELDSIETYLKGENSPEEDGKVSDHAEKDLVAKATIALADLYLSSFDLSGEQIKDATDKMRLAMKHEGL